MTNKEIHLRKKAHEQRLKAVVAHEEWARAVLLTFSGPGGKPRYESVEESKKFRKMYLRAYQSLYQKGNTKQETALHKEHRRIRMGRPDGIGDFYIRMLEAPQICCDYCGRSLELWDRQVDHYIPLSKGGTHIVDNLVVSCSTCNAAKGQMMPEDFIRQLCGEG